MDFLLWTARSLHVFSVIVWFGGLMYEAVVVQAVAKAEAKELDDTVRHFVRRFQPFVWMCVWTILVTGVALMLFNPRFVFFRFDDAWSVLLGAKQLVFLVMVFFSFGYARMFSRVDEMVKKGNSSEMVLPFFNQMMMFGKLNVMLAIIGVLVAAAM
jgi:putative copper export protein